MLTCCKLSLQSERTVQVEVVSLAVTSFKAKLTMHLGTTTDCGSQILFFWAQILSFVAHFLCDVLSIVFN